jgi:hypothetical protein
MFSTSRSYQEKEEPFLKPHILRNLKKRHNGSECVIRHCEKGYQRTVLPFNRAIVKVLRRYARLDSEWNQLAAAIANHIREVKTDKRLPRKSLSLLLCATAFSPYPCFEMNAVRALGHLRDTEAEIRALCETARTLEEAEKQISESAGKLESVVKNLFECYIMERFKTFFCEHEAAKHGYEAADSVLKEARVLVATEMDLKRADGQDLTNVDWTGVEGAHIVDAILERVIAVYAS